MTQDPRKPGGDEDPEIDPYEIDEASDETPTSERSPELDKETEDLTEWDDPPASHGSAALKVPLEDETSPTEQLIEEGLDQADRDKRIAAADPEVEP